MSESYLEKFNELNKESLHEHDDSTPLANDVKHSHLLKKIAETTGGKSEEQSWRNEPTKHIGDFAASKRSDIGKVTIEDLVGEIAKSDKVKKRIVRQLKPITKGGSDVPLPEHKQEAVDRKHGYDKNRKELHKWQSVVTTNRQAEQLVFPLNNPKLNLPSTNLTAKKFQPRTPLELEVAKALHGERVEDPILTATQEQAILAMSADEAQTKRNELMKYRAMLAYTAKKNRREKNIKSKTYRRHKRVERNKNLEKEMERLQKDDPELFEERMQKMERQKRKERTTLRHSIGSKKMTREKLYAKYNNESRQAIQEMIDKKQDLSKKEKVRRTENIDEEDFDLREIAEVDDGKSAAVNFWGSNPWIKDAPSIETQSQYQLPKDILKQQDSDEDSSSESEDDSDVESDPEEFAKASKHLLEMVAKKKDDMKQTMKESELKNGSPGNKIVKDVKEPKKRKRTSSNDDSPEKKTVKEVKESKKRKRTISTDKAMDLKVKKKKKGKTESPIKDEESKTEVIDATDDEEEKLSKMTINEIFDQAEANKIAKHKEKKRKVHTSQKERLAAFKKTKAEQRKKEHYSVKRKIEPLEDISDSEDEEEDQGLILSKTRKTTMEDMDGEWSDHEENTRPKKKPRVEKNVEEDDQKNTNNATSSKFVNPTKNTVIEISGSEVPDLIDVNDSDSDLDDDQGQLMTEAFETDDVTADFEAEKAKIIESEQVKDVNLSLPGWGSWTGIGVDESKNKRKIIKAPKAPRRKDAKLSNVLLSKNVDKTISKYQVQRVPFPFKTKEAFEKSIQAPIGRTWNTENSFKKLVEPRIVTKKGVVIKPMTKDNILTPHQKYMKERKYL